MKKNAIVMLLIFTTSSLMASYYSILESGFKKDNQYEYINDDNKKLTITLNDNELKFSHNDKIIGFFVDGNQHQLKSINNLKQVIQKAFFGQLKNKQKLQVLANYNYYFCEINLKNEKYDSKIIGSDVKVKSLELKVLESYGKNKPDTEKLLKFYYKNNIILGFKLYNSSGDNTSYKLTKIKSDDLDDFIEMKNTLKTVATYDDIKSETLNLVYKHKSNNGEHRLKVAMNLNEKNSKFTEIKIEGMSDVLSYGSKISQKQNIYAGVHTKSLFQTVGTFKDTSSSVKFKANPKKPMIKVMYANGEKKEYSRNKKTPYYNLAGLWMMTTNPQKDSVMLFDNSDTPKDFKVLKEGSSKVIFEKDGHSLYSFKVVQNLVEEFDISMGNYHFTLEDANTKSILENRKKLEDFKRKYKIVKVK